MYSHNSIANMSEFCLAHQDPKLETLDFYTAVDVDRPFASDIWERLTCTVSALKPIAGSLVSQDVTDREGVQTWNGRDDFAYLQSIENGGFPSTIETKHQYSDFLV
jgi:hypothetical protein